MTEHFPHYQHSPSKTAVIAAGRFQGCPAEQTVFSPLRLTKSHTMPETRIHCGIAKSPSQQSTGHNHALAKIQILRSQFAFPLDIGTRIRHYLLADEDTIGTRHLTLVGDIPHCTNTTVIVNYHCTYTYSLCINTYYIRTDININADDNKTN
jgi:hypothetical protein